MSPGVLCLVPNLGTPSLGHPLTCYPHLFPLVLLASSDKQTLLAVWWWPCPLPVTSVHIIL